MYHLFQDPIDKQQFICEDCDLAFTTAWYKVLGYDIVIIKSAKSSVELANYINLYEVSLN